MKKLLLMFMITFFLFQVGCNQPNRMQNIEVTKVVEGVEEHFRTIDTPKDVKKIRHIIENERWGSSGIWTGTDYIITFSETETYHVCISKKIKSISVFTIIDGETKEAVMLHEDAEVFYELLTDERFK